MSFLESKLVVQKPFNTHPAFCPAVPSLTTHIKELTGCCAKMYIQQFIVAPNHRVPPQRLENRLTKSITFIQRHQHVIYHEKNVDRSVQVKKTNCRTQFLRGRAHIFVCEGREGTRVCEKYAQECQMHSLRDKSWEDRTVILWARGMSSLNRMVILFSFPLCTFPYFLNVLH